VALVREDGREASAVEVGDPAPSSRREHGKGTAAAALAAGAAAAAVAGVAGGDALVPLALVALFSSAALVGARGRTGVAPYLALLLPIGYWQPVVAGVTAPALEVAAVGAALGCLSGALRERLRPTLGRADLVYAAFAAATVVLGGFAPQRQGAWLHNVFLWVALGVVFHFAAEDLRSRAARARLLIALGLAAVFEAVLALVEYVQASSDRFSLLGGAIVYPQPQGTLQHPNALGPFLVICLLLLAGGALAARGRWRKVAWVAVAVVAAGSVAPFSRGAWIALAAGSVAWAAAQRRPRRVITVVAAFVSVGVALAVFDQGAVGSRLASLGSRDFSTLYGFRFELAKRAAAAIARHPLTGAGDFHEIGMYAGRPTLATHPHDLALGIAVFYGIPAAVAFALLFAGAFGSAIRALGARSIALRGEAAGAVAALTALVVDGMFEYEFWNPTLTVLVVCLFAYATSLGRAAGPGRRGRIPLADGVFRGLEGG
jgi:hypothetical protein